MGKGSVIPGHARRIEEEGKVELLTARRLRPSTEAEVVGASQKFLQKKYKYVFNSKLYKESKYDFYFIH